METKILHGRGGRREGSGRFKRADARQGIYLRLAPDVIKFLQNNRPASQLIESMVRNLQAAAGNNSGIK
jgi:hypothetical protein